MSDDLVIGEKRFKSRFILGSGKFSLEMTDKVIRNGGVEIATLAVRRVNSGGRENVLDYMPKGVTLLPNTSGARNAEEALTIARLARELGCGDMIKIEVVRDSRYLLPDNAETIKAVRLLADDGFVPMPYMMPDLSAARSMADAGAAAIMPLAAPIGSNRGLLTRDFIKMMVEEIDLPIIVDAGIGRPSQACEAMEIGCAAVMANTAIATASDVPAMASAFKMAIEAGRMAYLAGLGRVLEDRGEASSPLTGFLGERDEDQGGLRRPPAVHGAHRDRGHGQGPGRRRLVRPLWIFRKGRQARAGSGQARPGGLRGAPVPGGRRNAGRHRKEGEGSHQGPLR
jgi:thiazole synthase